MLKTVNKRQRRIPGQFVEIALGQSKKAYGRVLKEPLLAFYNQTFDCQDDPSLEDIAKIPVAFKLNVMNSAITTGRWPVIGRADLTLELQEVPKFCKQDAITGDLYVYQEVPELAPYYERPATAAECEGLEAAAVWDAEHVEDRLRDHFAGRPNKWVEDLQLR